MEYARPKALIEPSQLSNLIEGDSLKIIDASYYLPSSKRNARREFEDCHIPGAVFFDIDEISDQGSKLPHMLPDPKFFSRKMGELGISRDQRIICYDTNSGAMAAMRVFWMFKVYSHEKVSLLNGGIARWISEGYKTEQGVKITSPQSYKPGNFDKLLVSNIDQVRKNCKTKLEQVVDARSSGRFDGSEEEPRSGLQRGHIPSSINLPFENLTNRRDTTSILSSKEILSLITNYGIDPARPIISTCGSGVTAAVLFFNLHLLGYDTVSIYDGSWSEWGSRSDTPIE